MKLSEIDLRITGLIEENKRIQEGQPIGILIIILIVDTLVFLLERQKGD